MVKQESIVVGVASGAKELSMDQSVTEGFIMKKVLITTIRKRRRRRKAAAARKENSVRLIATPARASMGVVVGIHIPPKVADTMLATTPAAAHST